LQTQDIARWLVDAALLCIVAEAAVLLLRRWARPRSLDVLWSLLAGFWLIAALRIALTSSDPALLALCLTAAGLCHATDLWCRLARHGPPPSDAGASPPPAAVSTLPNQRRRTP